MGVLFSFIRCTVRTIRCIMHRNNRVSLHRTRHKNQFILNIVHRRNKRITLKYFELHALFLPSDIPTMRFVNLHCAVPKSSIVAPICKCMAYAKRHSICYAPQKRHKSMAIFYHLPLTCTFFLLVAR